MSDTDAGLRIEPLDASALQRLLAIEATCFNNADGPLSKRAFRQHLGDGSVLLGAFVALDDAASTDLAGYALGLVRPTRIRLYSLAVDPRYRGRGLARTLTRAVIDATRARQLGEVSLEVRADNQAAIDLYESLGFTLERIRPAYYGDGMDAWRMLLPLS